MDRRSIISYLDGFRGEDRTVKMLEIKNLRKYQPHYNDGRKMIWVRWDISSMYDYKIVSLPVEAKWLFLSLICAACETDNNIPYCTSWLSHFSGIKKTSISKNISMLQTLDLVVTKCDEMSQNVPTDRQTDIQTNRQTSRFVKPKMEEIKECIKENGYKVNSDEFFNYYESNGWKVGRNPMKDWRATLARWNSRNQQDQPKNKDSRYQQYKEPEWMKQS